MTMVTRQNLLAEKVRFFISVGGIALSVFLFSFLLSLFQGWQLNVGRFVEHVEAGDVPLLLEHLGDAAVQLVVEARHALRPVPNGVPDTREHVGCQILLGHNDLPGVLTSLPSAYRGSCPAGRVPAARCG